MPLINIPIEFEYEGILFSGDFHTAVGNEDVWQLSLYRYSYGQLVKYNTGWKWRPNVQGWFQEPYMEQFFIKTVEDFLSDLKGQQR
jgi:hypothetical protein